MIFYRYEDYFCPSRITIMPDNNVPLKTVDTHDDYAYRFVYYELKPYIADINNWSLEDFKDKKFLDVGMGNGNVLYHARNLLGADVYGVDIKDYLYYRNYQEGKTFVNMDVCNLPKELLGTFDVAYQRLFSVPIRDTLKVLLAISKTLKENGVYMVTLDDDMYQHKDSFVLKILEEIYDNVTAKYGTRHNSERIYACIASHPKSNPILTPMDSYYYIADDDIYKKYGRDRIIAEIYKEDENTKKRTRKITEDWF